MLSFFNWSGGKDSALALYEALQDPRYTIDRLVTTVSGAHGRVSMHGVRREWMERQAAAIGLPLQQVALPDMPSMAAYEEVMQRTHEELKAAGYSHAFYGDIFLEDLKRYREQQLAAAGLEAVFPLWGRDTTAMARRFVDLGFRAIVVCVKESLLGSSFSGRYYDHDFLNDLPAGVDPCGENGEFHTFVVDGPLFRQPVPVTAGARIRRAYEAPKSDDDGCYTHQPEPPMGFWFCELEDQH